MSVWEEIGINQAEALRSNWNFNPACGQAKCAFPSMFIIIKNEVKFFENLQDLYYYV
jgi:hypothetical protein